jgi:excisionase family DNA binding protein
VLKESVQQEWVSYPEAERYSGLSHTTLWRYVTSGELKAARVGRSVRIHLPTLREFMEAASEKAVGSSTGRPRQRPEEGREKHKEVSSVTREVATPNVIHQGFRKGEDS